MRVQPNHKKREPVVTLQLYIHLTRLSCLIDLAWRERAAEETKNREEVEVADVGKQEGRATGGNGGLTKNAELRKEAEEGEKWGKDSRRDNAAKGCVLQTGQRRRSAEEQDC